jgi:hypothetical protein
VNLGQIRAEVAARGFDHVSPASRIDAWINRVYFELCEEEAWPFLESTEEGTAPLTVTDLRTIESVIDTTNQKKLTPLDRRMITDFDYTLSTAGSPDYYYTTTVTTVNVYPTNTTNTLSVRYWRVPDELTADASTPVLPARFHQVLVDGACGLAYLDTDNLEAADAMTARVEDAKTRMRESLLVQQWDRPDDFIIGVVDHQDG